MFLFRKRELPLHEAVLANDCKKIQDLLANRYPVQERNILGFTALELAQFLNFKECIALLSPKADKTVKVMHEGDEKPTDYPLPTLEKVFGIKYLEHPRFTSLQSIQKVICNCPYILRTRIGNEHRALANKYQNELSNGYVVNSTVKWINEKIGYGLFSNEYIGAGSFVGEYTGLVREISRSTPDHNPYCFHYPTRFWSWHYYVIDALWQGNETRFINHSSSPTLEPICVLDRGILHLCFIAKENIPIGTELTFDYGPDFWNRKHL